MRNLSNILEHFKTKLEYKPHREAIKDALSKNNVLLLGDLNLHLPGESKLLTKHGYNDCWLERKSHFEGLSWDTHTNSMTKWMLPFDNR